MTSIEELKEVAFTIATNSNTTFSVRIEAIKAYADLCLADNNFETKKLFSILKNLTQKEK